MTAFLQGPGVAVWISKIGDAGIVATLGVQPGAPLAGPRFDRLLVTDRPDRDSTRDQFRSCIRKVVRDEVQIVYPVERVCGDQLY